MNTVSQTNNTPPWGSGGGGFTSLYFTLQELTRSETARQRGLDNTPDAAAVENLQNLVTHILDPLRQLWGSPLYVNSGYRSPAVNAAVGGARNSQHLTGCAADITAGSPKKNRKLLKLILLHFAPAYSPPSREGAGVGLSFDQLIAERCDSNGNPRWLHISYSTHPRRQLLRT